MPLLALAFAAGVGSARSASAFNDIASPDGLYVLAVGDSGRMARSWNGGTFWSEDRLGTADLNALVMRGELALVAAGDGSIGRSTDAGGTWSTVVPAGGGVLLALDMPDDTTVVAAGEGGVILRSEDAGQSFAPQSSGVTARLRAVTFRDAAQGWAVGDGGSVLHTIDAGVTWIASAIGISVDLLDVTIDGDVVWIVGSDGTAFRGDNSGGSWTRVPLGLQRGLDVTLVRPAGADTVWIAGGGGFLRRSTDAGAHWTFAQQPALAPIGAVTFMPDHRNGLLALRDHAAVLHTTDGGLTWSFPLGTVDASAWVPVTSTAKIVRGSTIAPNAQQPNGLFCALGDSVFRSNDRGVTWTGFSKFPSATKTNAFFVSPYDSNRMVAAIGEPDRVVRSTNGGVSWATTLTRDFSEFGTPIQMDDPRPDTLLFAPEDGVLYRSFDFGATWDTLSTPGFRSPCDVVIVPDDPLNIWVGDGVTNTGFGQIFQSRDGGLSFSQRFVSTIGSEIPALTVAPLDTRIGIGTVWSRGGVQRTLDGGATWNSISTAQSAWGGSFSPDDPTAAAFGIFSGGMTFFSTNAGGAFMTTPITGSNYSIYSMDRGTWLATQSTGIYRFESSYAMAVVTPRFLSLDAPNGGETWKSGETHDIRWTAFNMFRVVLEYQTSPTAPWVTIAVVPAYAGTYAWTIPAVAGGSAKVRVRNAWDTAPEDQSDGFFTLASSFLAVVPGVLQMGAAVLGEAIMKVLTLDNPGNLTLDIQAIETGNPEFTTGRASLSIPPFGSDTLGVTYRPTAFGRDTAFIVLDASDPDSPHTVVAVAEGLPGAFAIEPARPNPFRDRTTIRYALPVATHVRLEVFNLAGQRVATLVDAMQAAGEYTVPFGTGMALGGGTGRTSLPAGVYFYSFKAGPMDVQRKIVMLR